MNRTRTILFVNGSESLEGDTRVLLNSIKALDRERFRAICVSTPGRAAEAIRRECGIEVIEAPLAPRQEWSAARSLNPLAAVTALAKLVRSGRAAGADLVYTYDRTRAAEIAYLGARLLRRPLLFHAHYPAHMAQRRLRRITAFHADAVIAISRFVAGRYREAGCPPSKLRVIQNGVESVAVDGTAPALREQLAIPASAPVVGMVGRLSPFKGQIELIEAAARLREQFPDLRVLISGRDTDESRWTHGEHETSSRAILERRIAELRLGETVTLLGFTASAAEVYAASDVIAAPSYEEPFGLVIVEAMLAGRAVVSCDAGGPTEIITNGETGVLVPPRDPRALAEAIAGLLADDGRRTRIAEAGQRHAEANFSLDRYAREFQAVIDDVIERRGRG